MNTSIDDLRPIAQPTCSVVPLVWFLLTLLGSLGAVSAFAQDGWESRLQERLPQLGHRNWIVIADSAYPLQTAPGVETIVTGADQLKVVQAVLSIIAKAKHVRPLLTTDAELSYVTEERAPGISNYREKIAALLNGYGEVLPHERIIAKLNDAGRTFHILVLKTNLTLPYTSVFLQLDCAYWSAEAEAELRAAIQSAKG